MRSNEATAEETFESLVEVVRRSLNLGDDFTLRRQTPLLEEGLALDSVGMLELLLAVERHFALRLDDDEINAENLATIGSLARLLCEKRGVA